MSAGKHRQDRERKRILRAAVMTAPVVTAGAVAVGMASAEAAPAVTAAPSTTTTTGASASASLIQALRTQQPTRSLDRQAAPKVVPVQPDMKILTPKPKVRYATDDLNIRATPTDDAEVLSEITTGTLVKATGVTQGDFAEVLWKGEQRWVTAAYLSAKRPATPESMGLSDKPCRDGSVENGLTSAAVRVYRAVCNNFPDITSYGGYDAHGEHSSGKAIDIMHPSVEEGYRIAEFLRAHASELGLYDVIWRQHIWTPVRSGEGWRGMPNRGSATANHFDHVHVSVN